MVASPSAFPMVGHVYADLIRAYRSRYPKVELTLGGVRRSPHRTGGAGGELDLAITMLPTKEGAPSARWSWINTRSG